MRTGQRSVATAGKAQGAPTRAISGAPSEPGVVSPALLATSYIGSAPDDVATGQIRFRTFGAADGLRNLIVASIVQDGSGMLWVATDDGAYRYDGQQLAHFAVGDGLPTMAVTVLGVAPDGGVCAGSSAGLVCWNGTQFAPADGVPAVGIQSLASSPGTLWVGTVSGLFVRRGSGPFVRAPGAATGPVKALWADVQGVVVSDGAALQISAGAGTWQRLGAEIGLGHERIDAVVRDREGALWIRSLHHLWVLRRGAAQVEDWSEGLPYGTDRTGAACGMALSPWGDVLVGSERGIAYRRDGQWRLVDESVGLPFREARAIYVDREGSVWVGSIGLAQWMGRGLISRHNQPSGLPGDMVWSTGRDRDGVLWIGTNQCLARLVENRWQCLPATVGVSVRTFVFPPQGGVFFGGSAPDLQYVDRDGALHTLELGGERIADRQQRALALSSDGDLWIATSSGLFRLPGAQPGRPQRVDVPRTQPTTSYVSLVAVGPQLWVAGAAGLAVLDRGSWHLFDASSGFRATPMRHVIRRQSGRMCVTFSNVDGVTCFRTDGVSVSDLKDITLDDGLTSGRVYFLGEDRAQRLWIGTGDGVDVVTLVGIDHFDEFDGLAGNDSAARSFFEDRDGSLWLGASGGLSHVRAQHYRGPPSAPRTTLLGGLLGDRPLASITDAAQLPHDQNSITATFAADGFADPRRVAFQVRLSPLERTWSTTRLREARYLALPPGGYQLELRARTGAGEWGEATTIAFAILPAWWQTRWFIVLAAVVGLAMLAATVSWRQRVVWRRRAKELHQQSDASFRALIESMPDLVSVYRRGKLVYLNAAARHMLGLEGSDDEWLGTNLADRVHPDDRAMIDQMDDASRDGSMRKNPFAELRVRASDGSWRNCELSSRRIELGDVAVTVISGRDVTERHRMRAKLLLSDRMASLGTLAAGIAHEINNPLAYVTGNLEIVAEALEAEPDSPGLAERKSAIADARDGAERVRKIVRGLRSFSHSEEEKRVPLALSEIVDTAIRMTSNEVRHRAVLVRELGRTPRVLADEGRLSQVLINLLVNAAHAIPVGRTDDNRITVRTRTDARGWAVVEVEDTGTGMPPEVLKRAFDPFFTTKAVGEGTGLGLAICHGIVTGLGGQISVENAPVHGCLVRVVLPPVVGEHVPATAEPVVPVAPAQPRRRQVMIVDDDAQVARAMKRILSADYELTLATCGAEAIDHVRAGKRFDAIITDVMMPNMTGIELFDQLSELAPEQASRVIFLTGGLFAPHTQARLDDVSNPRLQKPVSAQELRACVSGLGS